MSHINVHEILRNTYLLNESVNKRTISSDSNSDEDGIASNANTIEKDNMLDECDQKKSQFDSDDDESTVGTLKAKRRILDDSSSDEGVIDPYPVGEPRSFVQSSSPISRYSTMTPSTLTPTSQTSRLNSPMSKRCRNSSSPQKRIKKHKKSSDY